MLQNVVCEILEKDAIEDFNKPKGQPKGVLLKKFVDDVNSLGVTFSVWYKKNADGSRSNVLEYTSLVGAQKKLLLMKLPSMLENYLHSDTAATVMQIWNDFKEYYDLISDINLTSDLSNTAFEKAKQWLELFCSIRQFRTGYTRAKIAPYMHIMCYHVPFFIQKYGCFKRFTGQCVEKTMMMLREYYFKNQTSGTLQKIYFLWRIDSGTLRSMKGIKATIQKEIGSTGM